ncbi:hypothetical protein ACJIZ3_023106 [Penstemon smallii]|uniref:KAT8 regulatory NSL complex subunit 2 n=1 Tax=Penstemon smallii TaxID=265156 RepID=A0ABD3TP62_9LAMI
MPPATPSASASSPAAATTTTTQNPHSTLPLSFKPFPLHTTGTMVVGPSSSSSTSGPIQIDGNENDAALSKSKYLTRTEVLNRRARRVRQLARIYRDHYWGLMEEVKSKFREYCWEYGKSPFAEDEENEKTNSNCAAVTGENNGNSGVNNNSGNFSQRCGVHGCKAKAMALTRFCHMHILSDGKQKLYKACNFSVKSSTTGPILCGKPILRSTVPSYCPLHFQKAEKHMARALKKAGLNGSSTSKLAPKFHVIISEYVRCIRNKRRAAAMKSRPIKC